MSSYSAGRTSRPADPYPKLRLAALTAVIAGVVLLAAAAFVLSYPGIHQIALRAGIAPGLARLYPVIFDAMLVVAGAAALALRGAGWWARAYAWSALLLLLAAVAAGDALNATNVTLPAQPTRAVLAVTPWVLLLLAFGLWVEMLRHFRNMRTAGVQQGREPGQPAVAGSAAARGNGTNGVTGNGDSGAGQRTAVTWSGAGGAGQGRQLPAALSGLEALLGPKEGSPPATAGAGYPGQAGRPGGAHYLDAVSYGEETGYVHPDSYLGPGDYSGQPYPGQGDCAGQQSQHPGRESHAATGSLAVALANGEPGKQQVPGPGAARPGSPAPAGRGAPAAAGPAAAGPAAAEAVAAPPATEASPAATAPPAPDVPATVTAPPATDASSAAEEPQPAAESSPTATAETAAAGDHQTAGDHQATTAGNQDSAGSGSDTTPETAVPDPNPRLERLRSTPAPPHE